MECAYLDAKISLFSTTGCNLIIIIIAFINFISDNSAVIKNCTIDLLT